MTDFEILSDAKQLLDKYPTADVYFYSDTLTLRWKDGVLKGQLNWKSPSCCQILRKLHSQSPESLTTTILKNSVDSEKILISEG